MMNNEEERNSLEDTLDNQQSTEIVAEKKPSAWSRFLTAYSRFYNRFKLIFIVLWIFVILAVFVPILGQIVLGHSLSRLPETPKQRPHSEIILESQAYKTVSLISQAPNQSQINQEMLYALNLAHTRAEISAETRLDSWVDDLLMKKVDDDFLEWYFNWFNKKWREDSAAVIGLFGQNSAQNFVDNFAKEFSKRVLSPSEAQSKYKDIIEKVLKQYVNELNYRVSRVKANYEIPQVEWDKYLSSITFSIPNGNESKNFALNEILAVGGYTLLAQPIIIPAVKFGATTTVVAVERILAGLGIKVAGKIGAGAAAGAAAELVDPFIIPIFIAWDVMNYNGWVAKEKPAMRENILEGFQEMKDSLLNNPETGIRTVIDQVENNIRKSIISTSINQLNTSTSIR